MTSKTDRAKRESKQIEEKLRGEGNHREADIIRNLRRSLVSSTTTLSNLHADNMSLRTEIKRLKSMQAEARNKALDEAENAIKPHAKADVKTGGILHMAQHAITALKDKPHDG